MANEVRIDIVARNKTKSDFDAVKSAAAKLKDVMVNILSKNKTEGDFDAVKKDAASIKDVDITITAKNKTKSDFDSVKRDSNNLKKDFFKLGSEIGSDLMKNVSASFKAASGGLTQIIVGAAVVAAPLIGATLQAAIVGGAGFAGVGGLVALAARDARVKGAAKELGKNVLGDLEKRTKQFVGPVLQSISQIRVAFNNLGPDLDRIFKGSSKFLAPLTAGITGMLSKITKGVADAVDSAGPVMESFGLLFDNVGAAIGNMFTTLSQDSAEGATAINDLSNALVNLVGAVTLTIHGLATVKGWFNSLDENIDSGRRSIEDWAAGLTDGKTNLDLTADGMSVAQARAKALTDATTTLTDAQNLNASATDTARDALDELSKAQLASVDPTFKLIDAKNDMTEAQKALTDAEDKYGKNSPQAQAAMRDLAGKAIALQAAVGAAAGSMNQGITPALKATLLTAGFTEDQINSLEGQFKQAKAAGDRFAKTYNANVKVTGAAAARNSLYGVKDIADDIPRAVGIAIRITGVSNVSKAAAAIRKQYAHGGTVGAAATGGNRTGRTWVGERGPELVDLAPGTKVYPAGTSRNMAKQAMQSSQPTTLVIDVPNNNEASQFLAMMIQKYVRVNGGNVQQALGRI